MKLKSFSLITLASGILLLLVGIVSPLILLCLTPDNGSFSIIGGADAPTYQYVVFRIMDGWPFYVAMFGVPLLITGLFCLIFSKTVKTSCTIKTSAVSVGLSAVGGMGLTCALIWYSIVIFHEMSRYPIEYPLSVCLGMTCLVIFFALIALYFYFRGKYWSAKGFVIDVLTSILYLPAFFFASYCLYSILG